MENEITLIKAGPAIQRVLFGVIAAILLSVLGIMFIIFTIMAAANATRDFTLTFSAFGVIALVIAIIVIIRAFSCSVTVTNYRVCGKTFTKKVDLPLSQISAISRTGISGIEISTSSGIIRFDSIRNADKVYQVLTNLLYRSSTEKAVSIPVLQSTDADEIAKYKILLDNGAITQEEYETKKKQLLGL